MCAHKRTDRGGWAERRYMHTDGQTGGWAERRCVHTDRQTDRSGWSEQWCVHTDGQTEVGEQRGDVCTQMGRRKWLSRLSSFFTLLWGYLWVCMWAKKRRSLTPVPLPNHHATIQKKSQGCGLSVPCISVGILKTELYLWGAISTLACCRILV